MVSPNSYRAQPVNAHATTHAGAPPASQSASPAHQQTIASSHERSQMFGLAPHQAPDLTRLDKAALHELQHRNSRLCAQALPVMDMLYEQLTHAQSMVLLSDASGVVLHALGDPGFLERAQQIALAPGATWAEASKGTNAIGTALMTEAPTLVHGQEHYLRAMHFLTCSAAPIFDHKGALLGVIDVSGDRRSYHPHTLALAGMAARLIENQWFTDRFRHGLRVHLHPSAMGLGTLHEGVLALAEDGRVLGVNRRAIELLGLTAAQLRREALQTLFDCSLSAMLDRHAQAPDLPQPLTLLQGRGEIRQFHVKLSIGAAFHAGAEIEPFQPSGHGGDSLPLEALIIPSLGRSTAHEPSPSLHPAAPAPSGESLSLRDAELRAIQAAVQASGGNLSLAARQLGIGRSTLYRKLKAS